MITPTYINPNAYSSQYKISFKAETKCMDTTQLYRDLLEITSIQEENIIKVKKTPLKDRLKHKLDNVINFKNPPLKHKLKCKWDNVIKFIQNSNTCTGFFIFLVIAAITSLFVTPAFIIDRNQTARTNKNKELLYNQAEQIKLQMDSLENAINNNTISFSEYEALMHKNMEELDIIQHALLLHDRILNTTDLSILQNEYIHDVNGDLITTKKFTNHGNKCEKIHKTQECLQKQINTHKTTNQ